MPYWIPVALELLQRTANATDELGLPAHLPSGWSYEDDYRFGYQSSHLSPFQETEKDAFEEKLKMERTNGHLEYKSYALVPHVYDRTWVFGFKRIAAVSKD